VKIVDQSERTTHAAPHPNDALALSRRQRAVNPFVQEFSIAVRGSDGVLHVVAEAAHQP
jgi:hypothetical protein